MAMIRIALVFLFVALATSTPLSRSKRQTECRKENLFFGGNTPGGEYLMGKTEDECVAACKEMTDCVSVNYFALAQACLPFSESTHSHPDYETREEVGAVYITVKGCGESQRRKRQAAADCRKENVFVGGTVPGEAYLEEKTEEECIAACKEMSECNAVNYFPLHKACLPQTETLKNTPDLEKRDEENTVYIIVKNCDATEPESTPEPQPEPEPEPEPEPKPDEE